MGKKVLLTGATGFLGSAIAEELLFKGYKLLLTKRKTSDLWRTADFLGDFDWVNTDNENWISIAIDFKPEIIVNLAWSGVSSTKREDWLAQVSNIQFQQELLEIAKLSNTSLFVGFGSQAEYGLFDGMINESHVLKPVSSYGIVKVACSNILKEFCEINNIKWRWFRVFSVYGEMEGDNWLLSSVINKLFNNESVDLTGCEQRYAYLYIKDFAKAFINTLQVDKESGVYNFSSSKSITLKELLLLVKSKISTCGSLNFGKLEYRKNQPMLIAGEMTKFNDDFGTIKETEIEVSIEKLIEYKRGER